MSTTPPSTVPETDERRQRVGLAFGLAAYLWWGFVVFYFKAVDHVPALEVLGHRVVWSVVLLGALLGLRGRWREAIRALAHRPTVIALLATTALIAVNWYTFIWAVTNEHVMQASLGYYINPLVNVLLGFVFLRERLRRVQMIAVGLAFVAVLLLTLRVGEFPLVSLVLAFSFGFYGLLRKTMRVDGLVGLTVETTLLLPVAVGYLIVLERGGGGNFVAGSGLDRVLLIAAGVVTALPLLWFANAARRLDYATVGLLQYIAPSMQFAAAVVVFGEPFGRVQLVSFLLIWTALALYTTDSLRRAHRARRPAARTSMADAAGTAPAPERPTPRTRSEEA